MKYALIILMYLLPQISNSQDLSGIWRGSLTQEPGGCFPVYKLEIQLVVMGGAVEGYAYDYYDKSRFVQHRFKGNYNASSKQLLIKEDSLLNMQIPYDCVVCTKTYELLLTQESGRDALTGSWSGREADTRRACPPGKITLYKEKQPDFPSSFTDSTVLTGKKNALKLQQRTTEIVQNLVFNNPSIDIALYDNADVDNDTVTLYLNNEVLLFQQRLSNKALRVKVEAVAGELYELVMYADNLGTIPPNTALMTISSGADKYEVRLSASDKKNAAITFRVRKKE